MVVYYVNTFGFVQPFQIFQADGTTPFDLTAATVTWLFKDNTRTPTVTQTINGTITNAALGQVSFTIPNGFFTLATKWDCQIQVSTASLLLQTDPIFVVEILQGES